MVAILDIDKCLYYYSKVYSEITIFLNVSFKNSNELYKTYLSIIAK